MGILLVSAICLTLLRIAYFLFNHETLIPLGKKTASIIVHNGMLHYTSEIKARKILHDQELVGSPDVKSTFPQRRSRRVVWLLLNSNSLWQRFFRRIIIRRHCPNNPNGHDRSVKYETKLLIKGIRPEDIAKMYYNLECGIGCYTDCLKNVTIIPAPLDNVDRALGIVNPHD